MVTKLSVLLLTVALGMALSAPSATTANKPAPPPAPPPLTPCVWIGSYCYYLWEDVRLTVPKASSAATLELASASTHLSK